MATQDTAEIERLKEEIRRRQAILAEYESDLSQARTPGEEAKARQKVQGIQNEIQGLRDELRYTHQVTY